MAHLQMFTNTPFDEFNNQFNLKGRTWFFQMVIDTSYDHVIPIMHDSLYQSIIQSITNNKYIKLTSSNTPLPLDYNTKHNATTFINNSFVNFIGLSMALITVGIIYFILGEKESEMKSLIMLSGMNKLV